MDQYRVSGRLFIEGTMDEAAYDFDMEWEGAGEPTALDVLDYMMQAGIIQIFHEGAVLVQGEDEGH
jgi:hypothetical protein